MLNALKDFFWEKQPTLASAYDKAQRAGWQLERTAAGYTLHGVNHEGQADSWQFRPDQVADMNYQLDHVLCVALGEQYRQARWGDVRDDPTGEKKEEIRTYRINTYYAQEYKPGWKRLLHL